MDRSTRQAVPDRRAGPQRALLADDALDLTAAWLRMIAEPTRLRLMAVLNEGGASVQVLAGRLSSSQQNVSKHLGVLYRAGIVSRRKQSPWVHYELVDWTGWWIVEQIAAAVISERDGEDLGRLG